jgi:hypothetical protein
LATGLPALVFAMVVAQATGMDSSRPASAGAARPDQAEQATEPEESQATSESPDAKFSEPVQTGIPFIPSTSPPGILVPGAKLVLGVGSQVRSYSTPGDAGDTWSTDVEVTPGASLSVTLPTMRLGLGYGARLSFPINAIGPDLAVLQGAYLRVSWDVSSLWNLSLNGNFTYGDYSQLVPIVTPGAPGAPPSSLSPIRSFSTYPYIGAYASLAATGRLSARLRLRLSAGYSDVGGLGVEGQAAQPRSWGPTADASLDWDVTHTGTLGSSVAFSNSNVVGNFHIMVGTWRESWTERFSKDLEGAISAGAALTSTDSTTFVGFGHLVPVASASIKYYTDVRHAFRLSGDVGLAPFVDTYFNITYQRLTANLALDWYPSSAWVLGAVLGAGYAPAAAPPPQAYGTFGVSGSWAPWAWCTLSAGAFTQTQGTMQTFDLAGFRQWTVYLSVNLTDAIRL